MGPWSVQAAAEHRVTAPAAPHRQDIQGLRAIAILLVLVHHARLPGLPGGFLGVDMFFVISGYLMAGLIDNRLNSGIFTLKDFYARRIRRLFPAAYATLTLTALAAPWLLDSVEYGNFVKQLAGSFAFVVNIVLWKQTDYFSTAAELKPLLHMWSLAVEEQYYLGLPLLLLLCPKWLRLWAILALVAVSAAACAYLLPRAPSAAFYMLPTRAWELGLGGIVAILVNRQAIPAMPATAARLASLAVILMVAMLSSENGHPGIPAAIVCLATCILMVPGANWRDHAAAKAASFVGDRSYSLYLIHWPLFAFANNVFIGAVPLWVRLTLLALCFLMAEAQYRWVEQPLRGMKITAKSIALVIVVPVIVLSTSMVWSRLMPQAGAADHAPNEGLSAQCGYKADFAPLPACLSTAQPDTLVWGDSFAMHLVDGVRQAAPGGVVQATMMVCAPLMGIAPSDGGLYPHLWAQRCIAFNDSVLAYLQKNPQVKTVILSSILIPYLEQEPGKPWALVERKGNGFARSAQDSAIVLAALQRTVTAVRALGRKAVLFAPPPSVDIDFSRCQLRHIQGKPIAGANRDCTFSKADYQIHREKVLRFLEAVEEQKIVSVIGFDATLCPDGRCQTRWGNTILYADHAHLSRAGVKAIDTRMNWQRLIGERAR